MGRTIVLEPESHRQLAIDLFNRTWELVDKEVRSDGDESEMLTAAFASLYHWQQVGDAGNLATGQWQVSRVAAVLGYPDLSADYGRRSLETASEHDLKPFAVGYAHEALARAARLAGNRQDATSHLQAANDMLEQIADSTERSLLGADLAELESPGVSSPTRSLAATTPGATPPPHTTSWAGKQPCANSSIGSTTASTPSRPIFGPCIPPTTAPRAGTSSNS